MATFSVSALMSENTMQWNISSALWPHNRGECSALYVLYVGKPPVTRRFPSQDISDENFYGYLGVLAWINFWTNCQVVG